jgi:hypothetical protein
MGSMSISGWIFARPSVLGGAASILDFGNNLSEYNGGPYHQHDSWELAADWVAIREDIRGVLMTRVAKDPRLATGAV